MSECSDAFVVKGSYEIFQRGSGVIQGTKESRNEYKNSTEHVLVEKVEQTRQDDTESGTDCTG